MGMVLTAMPPIDPSTPIDAPMPIGPCMAMASAIVHACGVGVVGVGGVAGGDSSRRLPRQSAGEILIRPLSLMPASRSVEVGNGLTETSCR